MADLLPCPWSGKVPTDLAFGDGSTYRWLSWSCPCCGIGAEVRITPTDEGGPTDWREEAKQRARAEWNNRTPPAGDARPKV